MNFFFFKQNLFIYFLILTVCLVFGQSVNSLEKNKLEELSIGNENVPIKIIIYSSLTCPHCANFHTKVFPKIKEQYIDTGRAKVIFRDFPLDLAALNASKLLQCAKKEEKLKLLNKIYEYQSEWTAGKNIEEINTNLLKIFNKFGMNNDQASNCLLNEDIEEEILNTRIHGHKKYKIESTPTIIINEKKLDGPTNFENIDKVLKKII